MMRRLASSPALPASAILLVASLFAVAFTDESVAEINTAPLRIRASAAFPNVKWTGWNAFDRRGRRQDFRPIVLTHAGDDSNRIFVATQRGVIHAFEKHTGPQATKLFLDMSKQVRYSANENEEGFLGLAFHPKFKENGEFYIYYTTTAEPHTSIIARRRVDPNNPHAADPNFEETLLKIKQPFWNHNGGGIAFGPDGYLYISMGDGGSGGDPHGNGQNTHTLFATILRIDIDHRSDDKPYAIPADNPFANQPDAGRPEIYAYGLRNVWGMSFDSKTGDFWAADVGQNKWEEINLIVNGGNYGWNTREAMHIYPANKADAPAPEGMIDPVFEYDHDVGKSITGGFVYRGERLNQLKGAYVYADYVSGKIWALRYDKSRKTVVANQPIDSPTLPIISFGVDQDQELYFTVPAKNGKAIYQFETK